MSAPHKPLDAYRRELLSREGGAGFLPGGHRLVLGYPGTYAEAMASLGFLSVLRQVNERRGWCAERAVLGGDDPGPLRSLETDRPVSDYPVLGLSVAYEIQLLQVIAFLRRSGLAPLSDTRSLSHQSGRDRSRAAPLVVAGGPLTRINPRPLGAFVDVCLMGDSEETLPKLLGLLEENPSVDGLLDTVAGWEGFYVPKHHGDAPPRPQRASSDRLPARASLWSSGAEFGEMFLVEACRGCSMACRFCATRRSLSGGAHFVTAEKVLESIPEGISRVGLVGAEVGHHPELEELTKALVERGLGVSLSSLRADRLGERVLKNLVCGGLKSLTVAADGASERIRRELKKGVTAEDLKRAATLARGAGIKKLKVYQLVGVPGETPDDWEEMHQLALELAEHLPVELSFSCLVPKPGTPLHSTPVAPAGTLKKRIRELKRKLRGRVRLKEPALRWVEVEWRLAHGTLESGRVLLETVDAGGSVTALKKALRKIQPVSLST